MVANFQLKSSWFELLEESKLDIELKEAIFSNLVNTYSAVTRHYHNLKHIEHILSLLEEVKDEAKCLKALKFSAWFHDYIYNPLAQDNEIKSAVYAEQTLNKLNLDLDTIQLVKQIILSTKKHQPLTNCFDNLIFLDLDLAILGASPAKYWQYAIAIRQEYSYLSDRDYRQGRKQVLAEFLTRDRIYFTKHFERQLELIARNNLQTEIDFLSGLD